ncbi:D-3-phosphoglycerate dehydrogenase/(S)-sulfolactate dehydrogenase [Salirhabdus euzebyi]|uniref:D-3-phosphoglycerate dehydrogenase/(S)-sulfolactate dehydrogenase n=1 Tax=Salirhabdus euzebyi TaxID=394506 RepID=A0A841Q5L0_9BACI|nr:hydroxyacid dehydrogenase [Salirhabdus euzebyi]MBB6453675.1 D-3-phosphoglycerate dehydrogenase/(S)-sulfolactate dehydrogenase [Salirhabdus euzebyi]
MKIVITELIWPNGLELLEKYGDVEYDPSLWSDRATLLEKVKDADAIIVRNQTQVNEELLGAASNLKVVGRLGVGLDNIDIPATKKREVKVVFAKNANATSVAEYVFSAMFDASRNLSKANDDVHLGNWNRKQFTGSEICGKKLGLIGLGEIAQRVAKRAQAFGLDVLGYDPFVSKFDFVYNELGVKQVSLEELLSHSDFISMHVPLTKGTKDLIGAKEMEQMKSTAYLINSSRGGIINEADLLEAVTLSKIGGAYLDVIEQEPIKPTNPLLTNEKIILTPHIAGLTEEAQVRTSELVAEEVGKVLEGKQALCTV